MAYKAKQSRGLAQHRRLMLGSKARLNRRWIALAGSGSTLYRPFDIAMNQIEFVRTKYKTDARLQTKQILNVSRLEVRSIQSQYNPVQIRSNTRFDSLVDMK